ncbi:MAG: ribonuclease H [Bryobacterales bacterium]|nr:ribonuclease H [Bryobacterales bacterium]
MAKPRPKFYVVWRGHTTGVYADWAEASRQVAGFPRAKFKSFASREVAEAAFRGDYADHVGKGALPTRRSVDALTALGVDPDAVAVDAACSGVPGPMEYRGVNIATGETLFQNGPFEDGTNNVGEFLALVHALALLARQGRHDVVIYTDSLTALSWVRARQCRTKLKPTEKNVRIFELVNRAVAWLRANPPANPLRKWETDQWGEIPADYGRK